MEFVFQNGKFSVRTRGTGEATSRDPYSFGANGERILNSNRQARGGVLLDTG